MGLFANGFSLCPFVFDGVEIRRIRREVVQGMASLTQGVLNVLAFVEGGVIQDNHSGRGELREENLMNPGEEGIGVDAALKETDGDELKAEQGTDDVDPPLGAPVPATITALADGRIAVPAGHVVSKAAFVNPDPGPPGRFIPRPSFLKGAPGGFVRPRMHRCFF